MVKAARTLVDEVGLGLRDAGELNVSAPARSAAHASASRGAGPLEPLVRDRAARRCAQSPGPAKQSRLLGAIAIGWCLAEALSRALRPMPSP